MSNTCTERAFPAHFGPGDKANTGGMTLRDYFAAKAMQGLLGSDIECGPEQAPIIAVSAYVMADLMLKARGDA